MAERRRPGQPASAKPLSVGLVRDHRANDLLFGHVGRLTYVSADDNDDSRDTGHDADDSKAGIGKILANRFPGSGGLQLRELSVHILGSLLTKYSIYFSRSCTLPGVVSSNSTGHLWRSDSAPDVPEQAAC